MKGICAELIGPKKIVIREFEIPVPKDDEILLKVDMVSVCGSDGHMFKGHIQNKNSFPTVMGHETVGWVEKIGDKATEIYGLKEGDYVTVEPYIQCGRCKYCLTGEYTLCLDKHCYGVSNEINPAVQGSYANYMLVVPGSILHKVKKGIPREAACLSSVIGNGVRWARTKGKVEMYQSVVVIGSGPQGLSAIIAAKAAGASPIIATGLTVDKAKLELAKKFGADYIINAQEVDTFTRVKEITEGEMVDLVIEASGSNSGIQTGLNILKPLGRHMQAGVMTKPLTSLNLMPLIGNELTIVGGLGQAGDVEVAMKIINSGYFPIEEMVTHIFPLSNAHEAVEFSISGDPTCIKVAISCTDV